jgi:hypothetical protein
MSMQAMKQALEALIDVAWDEEGYCMNPDLAEAADALRAAISEQEQCEPVATKLSCDPYDDRHGAWFAVDDCAKLNALPNGIKLYTHPAQPPEGWQLVPVEPTEEMRKQMHYAYWQTPQLPFHDRSPELWNATYKAMLQAAPKPGESHD